jgi:hypothetical protein
MRYARCLLALAIWLLASCSDGTPPNALSGYWVHVRTADEPPGYSLGLAFTTTNGTVAGAGGWQGEAMPGGTVTASGAIERGTVTLDLTFTHSLAGGAQLDSFVEHFVGSFTSRDDLEGSTTANGLQGVLHLRRSPGP